MAESTALSAFGLLPSNMKRVSYSNKPSSEFAKEWAD
jgi:hypothetical protein